MNKHILFIQGGAGDEDHAADVQLVASLKASLGKDYVVHYPHLPNEESPDFGRIKQIDNEIARIKGVIILVGHSLGASMLLKYVSEKRDQKNIAGLFLISTPFWSGDEDWKQELKLPKDFAEKIPKHIPVFLYHSMDDEEVPIRHLDIYAEHLPQATIRKITTGGHQLNNDLSVVAEDIESL